MQYGDKRCPAYIVTPLVTLQLEITSASIQPLSARVPSDLRQLSGLQRLLRQASQGPCQRCAVLQVDVARAAEQWRRVLEPGALLKDMPGTAKDPQLDKDAARRDHPRLQHGDINSDAPPGAWSLLALAQGGVVSDSVNDSATMQVE
jgi:hypothetical protein